ncbi:MAG: hypothetical protein GY811_21090, partial [Myxococcales bacterium]|nr:hypothetical protein [Myxococcales bacterium]
MPRHALRENSSNCCDDKCPSMLGLVAVCLLLIGCKSGETELVGIGKYEIGKTTPADRHVMGKCRPQGANTFCFMNRSPSIAGHKTQTDLYFRGHDEKTAPLIEIAVGVWSCQVGVVTRELQSKLGEPTQWAKKRALWSLKKMDVVALLPKDDELCTVHFLDKSDSKRLASLFPGDEEAVPKPTPPKPTPPKPTPP